MRVASMRAVDGPASTPTQAAGGGNEVPGGEPGADRIADEVLEVPPHEPIPGERDPSTLTHREPGAIGGQFAGADTPSPQRTDWLDERTAFEHALEGGGEAVRAGRRSGRREDEGRGE